MATEEAPDWIKAPHALRHIGNMRFFFEEGRAYDEDGEVEHIDNIRNRFLLNNVSYTEDYCRDQARVLWEYMKYTVDILAEHKDEGGSAILAGLGIFTAPAMSFNF